jgi:hypothetical protein
MQNFLLTNRCETEDSVRFDLLSDGQTILQQVTFMKAFNHVLEHMADEDRYRYQEHIAGDEDEDIVEYSGAQLRAIHHERQEHMATLPQLPCTRCGEATVYIGYCNIEPYGPYRLQQTLFLQCGFCGLYRQIGFQNQDDWLGHTHKQLMQDRIPFVRVAHDPFIRNGTVRVTNRTTLNPIGRVNLDGEELHNRDGISIYDQEEETWRVGRIESDRHGWYFTSRDGGDDLPLRQGMLIKLAEREFRTLSQII